MGNKNNFQGKLLLVQQNQLFSVFRYNDLLLDCYSLSPDRADSILLQQRSAFGANVVEVFHTQEHQSLCGDSTVRVYCSHMSSRLCDHYDISLQRALDLTQGILRGYQKLIKTYGVFRLESSMVGINELQEPRVWLNDNFAAVRPSHSCSKRFRFQEQKEQWAIKVVLAMVQQLMAVQGIDSFKQIERMGLPYTFSKAYHQILQLKAKTCSQQASRIQRESVICYLSQECRPTFKGGVKRLDLDESISMSRQSRVVESLEKIKIVENKRETGFNLQSYNQRYANNPEEGLGQKQEFRYTLDRRRTFKKMRILSSL